MRTTQAESSHFTLIDGITEEEPLRSEENAKSPQQRFHYEAEATYRKQLLSYVALMCVTGSVMHCAVLQRFIFIITQNLYTVCQTY